MAQTLPHIPIRHLDMNILWDATLVSKRHPSHIRESPVDLTTQSLRSMPLMETVVTQGRIQPLPLRLRVPTSKTDNCRKTTIVRFCCLHHESHDADSPSKYAYVSGVSSLSCASVRVLPESQYEKNSAKYSKLLLFACCFIGADAASSAYRSLCPCGKPIVQSRKCPNSCRTALASET